MDSEKKFEDDFEEVDLESETDSEQAETEESGSDDKKSFKWKASKLGDMATAVVRIKDDKLYLYDIINIKKEASTPL